MMLKIAKAAHQLNHLIERQITLMKHTQSSETKAALISNIPNA